MANYHFEVKIIQRSRGQSVVDRAAYITAQKLRDSYTERVYDRRGHNGLVPVVEVVLPPGVPPEYQNIQYLLDALNASEKRGDAQMGRSYILALPLELTRDQQVELVREFVENNFTSVGQCTIMAIHYNQANAYGRDNLPPLNAIQENPHAHLVVPLRAMDQDGFRKTKVDSRRMNNPGYLEDLRKNWAKCQNQALERYGSKVRVSHESLAAQGIKRQPASSLSAAALALERKGVKTRCGDQYRETIEANRAISRAHDRGLERDCFRGR